ncbi:diguanylate cyclase domain-containing protein [Chitinibacter sp. GC72]|uniref:sensor domain-containing diguanylate cyclase n=1 Tax=Chitinibacter sp. GC72 TaxID=1526917 RepID=UPI0012FA825C|nr:diguanylate cyclase [Chitinibacter sp. GC72]
MQENVIPTLATALETEKTFEGVVRQLLGMLELVTDLESSYLTQIDLDKGVQSILYSRNSKAMQIPEGLSVPWGDTLCKRALEEKTPYTDDVAQCWGDSEAAKALGIATYASTPIYLEDGSLYGTLCATSAEPKPLTGKGQQFLALFAQLIAQYAQKERLVQQLQSANSALITYSYTDPLTGLHNRRAIMEELTRLFAQAQRSGQHIVLAFIDLDGFKQINDVHGHDAGDAFLVQVGQRLTTGLRGGDLLGRLGGDEFVVAGLAATASAAAGDVVASLQARIGPLLIGHYDLGTSQLQYQGASIGVVMVDPHIHTPQQAMQQADAAMYVSKKQRKMMH